MLGLSAGFFLYGAGGSLQAVRGRAFAWAVSSDGALHPGRSVDRSATAGLVRTDGGAGSTDAGHGERRATGAEAGAVPGDAGRGLALESQVAVNPPWESLVAGGLLALAAGLFGPAYLARFLLHRRRLRRGTSVRAGVSDHAYATTDADADTAVGPSYKPTAPAQSDASFYWMEAAVVAFVAGVAMVGGAWWCGRAGGWYGWLLRDFFWIPSTRALLAAVIGFVASVPALLPLGLVMAALHRLIPRRESAGSAWLIGLGGLAVGWAFSSWVATGWGSGAQMRAGAVPLFVLACIATFCARGHTRLPAGGARRPEGEEPPIRSDRFPRLLRACAGAMVVSGAGVLLLGAGVATQALGDGPTDGASSIGVIGADGSGAAMAMTAVLIGALAGLIVACVSNWAGSLESLGALGLVAATAGLTAGLVFARGDPTAAGDESIWRWGLVVDGGGSVWHWGVTVLAVGGVAFAIGLSGRYLLDRAVRPRTVLTRWSAGGVVSVAAWLVLADYVHLTGRGGGLFIACGVWLMCASGVMLTIVDTAGTPRTRAVRIGAALTALTILIAGSTAAPNRARPQATHPSPQTPSYAGTVTPP